jgi:hypothetical protein
MDALSLSHLTYCCATITVNFHRLDHPPFPCKGRLLPIRTVDKCPGKHRRRTARITTICITSQVAFTQFWKGYDLMKAATIVGILLIVLGIIGYATGGLSFTHQKKDVDLGPVQISHKTQDTLPLSPIFSTISVVAGIGLVVVGARAK